MNDIGQETALDVPVVGTQSIGAQARIALVQGPSSAATGNSPSHSKDISESNARSNSSNQLQNTAPIDPFQQSALSALGRGESVELREIPRSERARLVLNLISQYASHGKKVVMVSDDAELLNRVEVAASYVGIADLLLKVEKSTAEQEVFRDFAETLKLGAPRCSVDVKARDTLEALAKRLNTHVRLLKEGIGESGVSGYEALSWLVSHSSRDSNVPWVDPHGCEKWSRDTFDQALMIAEKLDAFILKNGNPGTNPWRGTTILEQDKEALAKDIADCHATLLSLQTQSKRLLEALNLRSDVDEKTLERTLSTLRLINGLETNDGALLSGVNFRSPLWRSGSESGEHAIEMQVHAAEIAQRLGGRVNFKQLQALNLSTVAEVVSAYQDKNIFGRLFSGDYERACSRLKHVVHLPKDPKSLASLVAHLSALQELHARCEDQAETIESLLGAGRTGADTFTDVNHWRKIAQVSWAVRDFISLTNDHPERKDLLEFFRKPSVVYEQAVAIEQSCTLLAEFKARRDRVLERLGFTSSSEKEEFCSQSLDQQEQRLSAMGLGGNSFSVWKEFEELSTRAKALGVECVARCAYATSSTNPGITDGLKFVWHTRLLKELFAAQPLLQSFVGSEQSELSSRLVTSDREVRNLHAYEIATQHWKDIPRYNVGGQAGFLHVQSEKAGGHVALSDLIQASGAAVQQAKPVFLLDSESAKKCLVGDEIQADLVIVDDARALQGRVKLKELASRAPVVALSHSEVELPGQALSLVFHQQEQAEIDIYRVDPFQQHLVTLLDESLGLKVHLNVRVGSARADIAVLDPFDATRPYLFVIQIDGLNYQSIEAPVAREKLATAMQSSGEARVLREWIVDWYKDPSGARASFIKRIKATLRKNSAIEPEPTQEVFGISREASAQETGDLFPAYRKTLIDLSAAGVAFRSGRELNVAGLADVLVKIVRGEGPIHRDELTQRFIECCGIAKATPELQLRLVEAEQLAIKQKSLLIRDDIAYFPLSDAPVQPRRRGHLTGTVSRFERIPAEELEAAVCQVVKNSCGISRGAIGREVLRAFGYQGVPFGADVVLAKHVEDLFAAKVLNEVRGTVRCSELGSVS